MQHYPEKKIIKLSMVVLFLSLLIIYALFYHMKGKELASLNDTINEETQTNDLTTTNNGIPQLLAVTETGTILLSGNNNTTGNQFGPEFYERYANQNSGTQNITGDTNEDNIIIVENTGSTNTGEEEINDMLNDPIQPGNIVMLSGTSFYHGPIDTVEKLGISYPYALKDSKDIYFVYLGDHNYDFADIVRQLNGYLYTLNTEQELMNNQLFGDKITFINIPEYKDNTVVMLIEVNGVERLVQISYSIYHENKTYLKSLFMN